jgi:hypothetical protein
MSSILALFLLGAASAAPASSAISAPRPLPGLWKMDGVFSTGKEMHGRICIGSSAPEAWKAFDKQSDSDCRFSRRRDGDQFVGDATCKFKFGKTTYTTRMRMIAGPRLMNVTMDVDMKGMGDAPGHVEAAYSYVGPCPASLKENQMESSDGTVIDLSGKGGS